MTQVRYPPLVSKEVKRDVWTAPFWSNASQQKLVVAACRNCSKMRMPPGPYCPYCLDQEIEWAQLTGMGTVYSYTIVRRAITPEMNAHVPYAPAVVTLAGAQGLRLVSAIVESPTESIHIDAPVEVVWLHGPGGQSLPYFRIT